MAKLDYYGTEHLRYPHLTSMNIDVIEGFNLQPSEAKVAKLKDSVHTMTDILIWGEKNEIDAFFE